MKRKHCGNCNRTRLVKFFAIRNSKTGLRQSWCRDCRKAYDKARYDEVPEKRRCAEKSRRIRERNRRFILEYLGSHPCVDCGESDPIVLEFDHVRGEKKYTIGTSNTLSLSVERISREIDKCEIRCANCHRRKSAKAGGYYRALQTQNGA